MQRLDFDIDVFDENDDDHPLRARPLLALALGAVFAVGAMTFTFPAEADTAPVPLLRTRVHPAPAPTTLHVEVASPHASPMLLAGLVLPAPALEHPAAAVEPAPAAVSSMASPSPVVARPSAKRIHDGVDTVLGGSGMLRVLDRLGATEPAAVVKAAAQVHAPSDEVLGASLDEGTIDGTMRERASAFRGCYERAAKTNTQLRGTLAVTFTIDKAGHVQAVKVVPRDGDTQVAGLALCVRDVVKRVLFAPPERALSVTRSLTFRPS